MGEFAVGVNEREQLQVQKQLRIAVQLRKLWPRSLASPKELFTTVIIARKIYLGRFGSNVGCVRTLIFALSASLLELRLRLTNLIIHIELW